MAAQLARRNRASAERLTGVLLDEIVDGGVLRHIRDGVGQHAVNRIGDLFVGRLESAFHVIAGAVVFRQLVAIGSGGNDRDICFGGDVVTHVA